MGEIRSLNAERANRENDNTLCSPAECLEDAAGAIRRGERACNKVMVLTLDTGEDGTGYRAGFYAAQMRSSEMLALLEAAKAMVLRDLGYIE